jgi:beta-glucanase (GH16 family)
MKVFIKLFLLTLINFVTLQTLIAQNWQLVWQDEFNGSSIDESKWEFLTGPWGETSGSLQYYTDRPENAFVENDHLVIQALKETYEGYDYTAAYLRTLHYAEWQYGRFEIFAKLPYGQGLWPGIWLLPSEDLYGVWPANGEIDIMECLGHLPHIVYGHIHYGGDGNHISDGEHYELASGDFSQDYHLFALEWEPGEIRWYVDEDHYFTRNNWHSTGGSYPAPFDRPFYLILNIFVGGNWGGPPDETTVFPQRMEIDYVRVYKDANKTPSVSIISPSNGQTLSSNSPFTITVNAEDPDGTIEKVGFYQCNAKLGEKDAPYDLTIDNPQPGSYHIKAIATDNEGTQGISDVIDIIVDQPNVQAPYTIQPMSIPGNIEMEDFNIGGEGTAYHDQSAQNAWDWYTTKHYRRNERVDIVKKTGVGKEYFVFWIESGEWLNYTVNVIDDGYFDITAIVASDNNNGTFHFMMDGSDISGEINAPNTGGWNNWETVSKSNVYLSSGNHILKFMVDEGGFDIDKIAISTAAGILEAYQLFSNSPNPFNSTTEISYSLLNPGFVTLKIYDMLGREIQTLVSEFQEANIYSIDFNARELSSGIYSYRLKVGNAFEETRKMILIR